MNSPPISKVKCGKLKRNEKNEVLCWWVKWVQRVLTCNSLGVSVFLLTSSMSICLSVHEHSKQVLCFKKTPCHYCLSHRWEPVNSYNRRVVFAGNWLFRRMWWICCHWWHQTRSCTRLMKLLERRWHLLKRIATTEQKISHQSLLLSGNSKL